MLKLADLQLATQLQAQLAAIDDWPRTDAVLDFRNAVYIELNAEEIAAFIEWRQQRIKAELRRLGIDTGDGPAPAPVSEPMRGGAAAARLAHNQEVPGATPGPATTLSRAEATERVTAELMAEHRHMLANGAIDPGEYEKRLAQRQPRIAERVEELLRPALPAFLCEDCDDAATTTVAGRHFCDTHARFAPRLMADGATAGMA